MAELLHPHGRQLPNFDEDCPSQEESSHGDWQEWMDGPPGGEVLELPFSQTPGGSSSAGPAVLETPPPVPQARRRLRINWEQAGYSDIPLGASSSSNPPAAAAELDPGMPVLVAEDVVEAAMNNQNQPALRDDIDKRAKSELYNRTRNAWCKQWVQDKNSQQRYWLQGTSYYHKRDCARKAWQELSKNQQDELCAQADPAAWKREHRNEARSRKGAVTAERCTGQLHTYNYPMLDIPFLYGALKTLTTTEPESLEFKEAVGKVASHPTVIKMWEEWKTEYKECCKYHVDVAEVSVCCELSLHARNAGNTGLRLHFHAAISNVKDGSIPRYDWADWAVKDVFPDVQNSWGRGKYHICAIHRMHMYAQVPKVGHLFGETNFPMYHSFQVKPQWLMELWQSRKMDRVTLKSSLLETRSNCIAQFRFIEFWEEEMLAKKTRTIQEQVQKKLRRKLKRFKTYPVIATFMQQYTEDNMGEKSRFLFLVFEGPSSVGKTVLAKSLFGEEATYYYNMQNAKEPDLRRFCYLKHKALLLDEISWQQVIRLKVLFQAGVDGVDLGASQCNQFAYWRFLYGVAIICCTNKWLPPKEAIRTGRRARSRAFEQVPDESADEEIYYKGMHDEEPSPEDREWLETNSMYSRVTSPTWFDE